ncbi:Cytochrome P450 4C1, partial [Temnothorax longispinosus]
MRYFHMVYQETFRLFPILRKRVLPIPESCTLQDGCYVMIPIFAIYHNPALSRYLLTYIHIYIPFGTGFRDHLDQDAIDVKVVKRSRGNKNHIDLLAFSSINTKYEQYMLGYTFSSNCSNFAYDIYFQKFAFSLPGASILSSFVNSLQIAYGYKDLLNYVDSITKKYGNLTRFIFGTDVFVVLAKPEDYKCVLANKNGNYKNSVTKTWEILLGDGILRTSGAAHRLRRKIIQPLLTLNHLSEYVTFFDTYSNLCASTIEKNVDGPMFELKPYMVQYAFDTFLVTMMGIQRSEHKREDDEIVYWQEKYITRKAISHTALQDNNEISQRPKPTFNNYWNCVEELRNKVTSKSCDVSDENFLDDARNFFAVIQNNITEATTFIILMLAMHTEVQEKLREEISVTFNNKKVDAQHLLSMRYFHMVYQETLRLFPILPKEALPISESCTLPDGCYVMIPIFAIHRNPAHWYKPLEFIPERFSPENSSSRLCYAYIPFGAGLRDCLDLLNHVDSIIKKYGNLTRLIYGTNVFVVLAKPEDYKCVLANVNGNYKGSVTKSWERFLGNGLARTSGPPQKLRRKIIEPLLNLKYLFEYVTFFDTYSNLCASTIEKNVDGPMFELKPYMVQYVFDTFLVTMMGIQRSEHKHEKDEIEKLREEISVTFNNNKIDAQHLLSMRYFYMVYQETFRLFPIVPIISRQLTGDIKLGALSISESCTLPDGCYVMIPVFAIHRNPAYWYKPLEFIPERFSPENSSRRLRYTYIPFGTGLRDCLGQRYTYLSAATIIVNLLRRFRFTTTVSNSFMIIDNINYNRLLFYSLQCIRSFNISTFNVKLYYLLIFCNKLIRNN